MTGRRLLRPLLLGCDEELQSDLRARRERNLARAGPVDPRVSFIWAHAGAGADPTSRDARGLDRSARAGRDQGGDPPSGRSPGCRSAKSSYARACRAGARECAGGNPGGRRSAGAGGSESPRRRRAPGAVAPARATARAGSIATADVVLDLRDRRCGRSCPYNSRVIVPYSVLYHPEAEAERDRLPRGERLAIANAVEKLETGGRST